MRERFEPGLKVLCYVLGGLLVLQLALRLPHLIPLHGLKFPPLPALAQTETNSPGKPGQTGPPGLTNKAIKANAQFSVTNSTSATTNLARTETNSPGTISPTGPTNLAGLPAVAPAKEGLTNNASQTNSPGVVATSHAAKEKGISTNSAAISKVALTNAPGPKSLIASNMASATRSNATSVAENAPGRRLGGRPMPGAMAPELPPDILARVDRVVDSELFGQVMHPMPMALMGIAGDMAFLRAPGGQSGAIKEGESLGEIKLVRIGINRVLIENDGKKEELTIFDGLGGESLMPK